MKKRYQYRIYPTSQQRASLAQTFGCARVVFNDALALCKNSEGKWPSNGELQKLVITQAKKTAERGWLSEVSVVALQQSVQDLGVAFKNFFESRSGKRKGPKVNFPRFKRKANRQSARFTQRGFSIKNGKVNIAKVGAIKTKWSRALPSAPTSVTIIKDVAGRYFASFVVEVGTVATPFLRESIGVDLGIKTFAFLSTGEAVHSPEYKRLDRKILRAQRVLSRRQKGSNRREAARLKVARLKTKLKAVRKDFLDKLSTRLVIENAVVCLEDLNVKGMVKNRCLARAISEAGWGMFRQMCEAKAAQIEDRRIAVISRWEPTSQTCSDCGFKWGKIDLSIRSILCVNCGTEHDRDGNAAKNIEIVGVGHAHDSKRTGRAGKTALAAQLVEPSSQPCEVQLGLCF